MRKTVVKSDLKMGSGTSKTPSQSRRGDAATVADYGGGGRARSTLDDYDLNDDGASANGYPTSLVYAPNRLGNKQGTPREPSISMPSISPSSLRSLSRASTRPSSAEERLNEQRAKWARETAKRIHVVVRVRPLSLKEIKQDAKVIRSFTHFCFSTFRLNLHAEIARERLNGSIQFIPCWPKKMKLNCSNFASCVNGLHFLWL